MQTSSQSSFIRAVSVQMPTIEIQKSLIAQGMCAIALPLIVLTLLILRRKHLALKREYQIERLEQLWHQDSNDRV